MYLKRIPDAWHFSTCTYPTGRAPLHFRLRRLSDSAHPPILRKTPLIHRTTSALVNLKRELAKSHLPTIG